MGALPNDHAEPDPDRPRLAKFKSQAADAVFGAFLTLDTASRWDVLHAIQSRLAIPTRDRDTQASRREEAIRALREATGLNNDVPLSVNRFEQLSLEYPDSDWPPVRSIKRWLGVSSWNDALRAAHLDAVPDGDVLVAAQGPALTGDEVTAALNEATNELGFVPSFGEFIAWAHRPEVRVLPGRRPMSQAPFTRLFGGFTNALAAAGLIEATSNAAAASPLRGMIRGAGYWVSDERIHSSLQTAAKRLGRSPRTQEYIAERSLVYEETTAAGEPQALVSYGTICRRYRCWDDALVDAGLEPLGGQATGRGRSGMPGRKGPRIGDQQIAAGMLEAYEALGEPFTQPSYSRWRREEIKANPRRKRELPSYHTIWQRFGTWDAAVRFMLASESEEPNPDKRQAT